MRREHFESLRPVCPACRAVHARDQGLVVHAAIREDDDAVHEGDGDEPVT